MQVWPDSLDSRNRERSTYWEKFYEEDLGEPIGEWSLRGPGGTAGAVAVEGARLGKMTKASC